MLDGVGEEVGVDEDGVGRNEGGVVLEKEGGLWGRRGFSLGSWGEGWEGLGALLTLTCGLMGGWIVSCIVLWKTFRCRSLLTFHGRFDRLSLSACLRLRPCSGFS